MPFEKNLAGVIIDRYERAGLKIVDLHYYRSVNEIFSGSTTRLDG
jgi:nucleoside diphosphate kinase